MSKEVETISTERSVGEVSHMYSYWANLMINGEASEDDCQYPSQTSVLARNGEAAWQALTTIPASQPPTVELLD